MDDERFATDADLMASFCSLGGNCEFGVAQRAYNAEPIDLLRWAGTNMAILIDLLDHRFEGIDETLEVSPHGGEWILRNRRYRFNWHTWARIGDVTAEKILAREQQRLPFLARKLVEELTDGRRVFVRLADSGIREEGLARLRDVLRQYGNPELFFVRLATSDHPADTVERTSDGLLRGYLGRIADEGANVNATTPSADWLALCRAAREIVGENVAA